MPRILLLFACIAFACFGQTPVRLPWLTLTPTIDGRLDPPLASLPGLALRSAGKEAKPLVLRIGTDAEALYVHTRSPQQTFACRDRAYQNGDGLILVLATPSPAGSPTRRFRVMGFSPQPEMQRNWQYAFTWYRDVGLQMTPLPDAQFAWHKDGDALEFEMRIPWAALAPYHPLLTPEVGINACFVRAEGEDRQFFLLKEDPNIQSEQKPRAYLPTRFDTPPAGTMPSWYARPAKGHLEAGARLAITAGAATPVELRVRVMEGEGTPVGRSSHTLKVPASPMPQEVPLEGLNLSPGGYLVEIQGPGRVLSEGLTVLPKGGIPSLRARLDGIGKVSPGTRATLAFRIADAEAMLARMAPTDPAPGLRRILDHLDRDIGALERGSDPVATRRGLQRRAYLSALDQTLQPYTLRVPELLNPNDRHPLLVYLHGSGQDDQGVLDIPRAPGNWFELAPFGRGTSNCFSADHAQTDLREAIEDVLAHYPVDPSCIVLAGFSMGGYGVYRTAYERPGFFKGLAIFSGVPDVATRWLGPGHPDFLEPGTLSAFSGVPVFIFHGTADRNCPFEKTQRLVGLLRKAGAHVTFVMEEGKGHEYPTQDTIERFMAWVSQLSAPTIKER